MLENVVVLAPAGNSHGIEVNGCTGVSITNCDFGGTFTNSVITNSAILVNNSNSATSPQGLNHVYYNNQNTDGLTIVGCGVISPSSGYNYTAFGALVGSDVANSSAISATGIVVTGCSFIATAPNGPIYPKTATWGQSVFGSNGWGDGAGSPVTNQIVLPYDDWVLCHLKNGFSSVSSNYQLQYKISQDGTISLFGGISLPNSGYTSPLTTLPYQPTYDIYSPVALIQGNLSAFFVRIDTGGNVTLQQTPGGIGGLDVFINTTFPADYSGNGLNV
jgi:hypothetical protein